MARRPNILFFHVDNLGMGELGCYGGGILRGADTKRIDTFRTEGVKLTHYVVEPQCTPTRSALMTGRYPIRSGNHTIALGGNTGGLVRWLAITALLGAGFVTIQGFEFSKLVRDGVVFGNSQFASAFYFLTGNHGLHVIIGVIWCLTVIVRALRGGFTKEDHLGVEIFGLYWHFVDVVWILIFTMVYLI